MTLADFINNCDLGFSFELSRNPAATEKNTASFWVIPISTDDASVISADDMRTKTIEWHDSHVIITWQGHENCGDTFVVTTTWEEKENGRFEGQLHYSGYHGDAPIEMINFPMVKAPVNATSKTLEDGFLVPVDVQPIGKKRVMQIKTMEFTAVVNTVGDSCYMDWRDPDWTLKFLSFKRLDETTLAVSGKYLLPLDGDIHPAGDVPYPCSVAYYRGNWFEATRFYKPWGTSQSWWTHQTDTNPLADIGLWVWNRGLANDVIPPVLKLQQDLGPDIRVALDWYWWHHNPYDTDYPNFWPPREGEETFKKQIKRLTEQHIYCQVYINGVCWDHDTDNWTEGGDNGVCIRRNGLLKEFDFNKYNHHRLAWMCGSATTFQDKMAALVKEIHAAGLTGQYMDMIGCSTFEPCYNPKHKHPMGGGTYLIDGYRRMLKRIIDDNPGYPITSETASEPYMDLLSGGIICSEASAERMGRAHEFVPAFMAVYHGRYAAFGNYAIPDGIPPWDPLWPSEDRWQEEKDWHHLYPEMFFIEMIRPVIWGAQPMVCNLRPSIYTSPEFADEYAFILETARFYWHNREFLYSGTMLSPDGFACDEHNVEFFYRMIFTTQANSRIITRHLPNLLHSCWQNAHGDKALFVGNYTRQEQKWSFNGKQGAIQPLSYAKIDL